MIVSLKQRKMNLHVKPRIKLNNNIYIVFINELNNYMKIFMESTVYLIKVEKSGLESNKHI